MRPFLFVLLALNLSASASGVAFPSAVGFGASAKGGAGGPIIEVTRLDDDPKDPQPGSFRWAAAQKGPRIIRFVKAGTIMLKDSVTIDEPFITIDGQDAPGQGVCLRGGSLEFKDSHDIIVRYLRVRLGDESRKQKNREQNLKRPKNSGGLDCISFTRCQNAIIDHISASWCCDELFSVVHCQDVTVQHCLFAEPLTNPELHTYGDNHAFCFNASASNLSVVNCLFARYVMRGPQFEANDMRRGDSYAVQMEAVNNLMFDYQRSGSRYTTGIEDHKDEATPNGYAFQFIGNTYIGAPKRPAIEAVMKHGVHAGVRAYVDNPTLVQLSDTTGCEDLMDTARSQLQPAPLFITSATTLKPDLEKLLNEVGCSHHRDTADQRIIENIRTRRFHPPIHSQTEVGGWPDLK